MDEKDEKQKKRRNVLREKLLRCEFGQDYCHGITVGRSLDNDIIINYPDVDRHHCLIEENGEERFRIIDLDSVNGTFVNGMRVEGSMEIGPYDEVRVGTYRVAWLHQFSRPETILIPPGGHMYFGEDEPPLTQQEDSTEDVMKKKREELSKRLINGEIIAFGEGGKIVDVDSEEKIGTIPYSKFGD